LNSMSKHLKKFFDLFPSYDLPKEKEDELIEKIAQNVSKLDMDLPAILIGHVLIPTGSILAQTVLVPVAPMLELIGIRGYDYLAIINNRRAVKRLMDRIEELRTAKEKT